MDEKSLIYFRKTAELEHLTRAAKALYISPAQLSRCIAEIERELGAPLFERANRGIKLNATGKAFYEYVIKISALYEEAKQAVRASAQKESFLISLGTNTSSYSPGLLGTFSRIYPQISVHDIAAPRNTLISMLRDGRLDFIITAPLINDIDITSELLVEERPLLIYPPDHWLQNRTHVSLSQLENASFIGVPKGYGTQDSMTSMIKDLDYIPHMAVETSNTYMVERYVEKGLGVALIPKSVGVQSEYSKQHCCAIDEDRSYPVGISWMKDKQLTKEQQDFLGVTHRYFEKDVLPFVETNIEDLS